jgi:hypothetical protein
MASIPLRGLEIPRVLASVEVNIDTLSTGRTREQYILDAAWGQTQSSAKQNSAWAAGLSFGRSTTAWAPWPVLLVLCTGVTFTTW